MTTTELPHPFQHNLPTERLQSEYFGVTVDRNPDPRWHFRLNLHRTTRIAPDGTIAPTVAQPFQTLALFQRPEPLYDLEIFGLHLPAEVEPADWLDLWLLKHNMVVVSSKPIPTSRGLFGDAVCTWNTPEGPFAGRFATLRWGNRIFLMAMRTPRHLYPAVADDFFIAVSSLLPIDVDEQHLDAEAHQVVDIPAPLRAKVSIPVSYTLQSDLADPRVSAYGAEQQSIADLPDDPVFGKLNFLVAQAALADHPAKAAGMYLQSMMQNPLKLGSDEFVEEPPTPPFQQAWLLVSPAILNPAGEQAVECELRCRILARADIWLVAGVLGAARHLAPIAWMRNKRAMDLACQTFTTEPAKTEA